MERCKTLLKRSRECPSSLSSGVKSGNGPDCYSRLGSMRGVDVVREEYQNVRNVADHGLYPRDGHLLSNIVRNVHTAEQHPEV